MSPSSTPPDRSALLTLACLLAGMALSSPTALAQVSTEYFLMNEEAIVPGQRAAYLAVAKDDAAQFRDNGWARGFDAYVSSDNHFVQVNPLEDLSDMDDALAMARATRKRIGEEAGRAMLERYAGLNEGGRNRLGLIVEELSYMPDSSVTGLGAHWPVVRIQTFARPEGKGEQVRELAKRVKAAHERIGAKTPYQFGYFVVGGEYNTFVIVDGGTSREDIARRDAELSKLAGADEGMRALREEMRALIALKDERYLYREAELSQEPAADPSPKRFTVYAYQIDPENTAAHATRLQALLDDLREVGSIGYHHNIFYSDGVVHVVSPLEDYAQIDREDAYHDVLYAGADSVFLEGMSAIADELRGDFTGPEETMIVQRVESASVPVAEDEDLPYYRRTTMRYDRAERKDVQKVLEEATAAVEASAPDYRNSVYVTTFGRHGVIYHLEYGRDKADLERRIKAKEVALAKADGDIVARMKRLFEVESTGDFGPDSPQVHYQPEPAPEGVASAGE